MIYWLNYLRNGKEAFYVENFHVQRTSLSI